MDDILDDLKRYKTDAMRSQDAGRQIVYTRAIDEIERLRAIVSDACEVLKHYDLPEHAFHYQRALAGKVPLTQEGRE